MPLSHDPPMTSGEAAPEGERLPANVDGLVAHAASRSRLRRRAQAEVGDKAASASAALTRHAGAAYRCNSEEGALTPQPRGAADGPRRSHGSHPGQ
jgi:hypothetical protein